MDMLQRRVREAMLLYYCHHRRAALRARAIHTRHIVDMPLCCCYYYCYYDTLAHARYVLAHACHITILFQIAVCFRRRFRYYAP